VTRDPIVEEIHRIRREILEECGNDPARYFARLKAAEDKDRDRLVAPPPRAHQRPVSSE
jgi:hypothetical protein